MKRLSILIVISLLAGCGDSAPTGPDDDLMLTGVEFLTLAEFDGYIADVQSTIPDVNIMIAEFAAIAADFNAGFVPDYWIGEYTKNLLRRVDGVQAQAMRIRPQHPELLKLHTEEYEASLAAFNVGFTLFVQGIEQPGSVGIDAVNDHIVDGNTHLIRLQILLGDLGGRNIDFFAQQGGGGQPDDGFDGFGF